MVTMTLSIALDENGYLANAEDWSESIANELAQEENIVLTAEHWLIIRAVREYYQEYNHSPPIRPLIKLLQTKYGFEKLNSAYLHRLFPISPARQAARISGLPKPVRCI
jgi:tRNA 2-thiouridine synthesizing protein E